MKRRKKTLAVHPLRALDPEAWKVFARKAGAMKHRRDKRVQQQMRKERDEAASTGFPWKPEIPT